MTETEGPGPKGSPGDREVDYLMCSQCGTPCYVFEMEEGRVAEAMCLVCGNDVAGLFSLGEDESGRED